MPSVLKKVCISNESNGLFLGTVEHILNEYALIDTERRLNEIITGYLDTSDDEIPVSLALKEPSDESDTDLKDDGDDDGDDEANAGPDPEEALIRFTELRKQYEKTSASVGRRGRTDVKAKAELEKLGELFKNLKLTPRQFDPLLGHIRAVSLASSSARKRILNLSSYAAKTSQKIFIETFPGHETNEKWIDCT